MSKGIIHVVCLDAPSPPDYGGVYDLYYKIPALAKMGYEIILHYFDYKEGRGVKGLEPFCKTIYKYQRKAFWRSLFSSLPYIIHSRINGDLIRRLNKDATSVIIEGVHCAGIIPFIYSNKCKIIVRIPNNESIYYNGLALLEKSPLKRIYLKRESRLLEKYQATLLPYVHYSFIAQNDRENFKKKYGLSNTSFIPVFIPWDSINGKKGKGNYCIYHGNLSVSENVTAAQWLIENVFKDSDFPLIVAGKAPSRELQNIVKKHPNIQLISDPPEAQMETLINDAHIHLLPSFNKTGIKLKVLHALFNGRFCITNNEGIEGSGINKGALIANTAADYKDLITSYMGKTFTSNDISERQYLLQLYNNDSSAEKLSAFL